MLGPRLLHSTVDDLESRGHPREETADLIEYIGIEGLHISARFSCGGVKHPSALVAVDIQHAALFYYEAIGGAGLRSACSGLSSALLKP